MEATKTGAVICRRSDAEKGMIYRALLFIRDIPAYVTDNELKAKFTFNSLPAEASFCDELYYRADIHSTSNEVQEQFEHLHPLDKPVPEIRFTDYIKL